MVSNKLVGNKVFPSPSINTATPVLFEMRPPHPFPCIRVCLLWLCIRKEVCIFNDAGNWTLPTKPRKARGFLEGGETERTSPVSFKLWWLDVFKRAQKAKAYIIPNLYICGFPSDSCRLHMFLIIIIALKNLFNGKHTWSFFYCWPVI